MFGEEIKKQFKNITIDGCDISADSLKIAKKNKFIESYLKSFEKKIIFLINMI